MDLFEGLNAYFFYAFSSYLFQISSFQEYETFSFSFFIFYRPCYFSLSSTSLFFSLYDFLNCLNYWRNLMMSSTRITLKNFYVYLFSSFIFIFLTINLYYFLIFMTLITQFVLFEWSYITIFQMILLVLCQAQEKELEKID